MKSVKPKLSFGAKCLWLFCRCVAILPRWVRYNFLGGALYYVLCYIVRYRRALIVRQIADSFPEKSEREVEAICKEFYGHLAEVIMATISLAGITDQQRRQAISWSIPDSVREAVKDRHFVVLASHHGFWEYAQYIAMVMPGYCEVGAYHPLSNELFDELFIHLRTFEDIVPVPSARFLRYFIEHKDTGVNGKPMILGLASDQNAPPKGEIHWFDFLNRPTLFFSGGEQLAMKFNLPVVYFSLKRTGMGKYHCDVVLLHDGRSPVEKNQIMEQYVRLLEDDIRRDPARWMWSHRRWKYYPDPVTGEPIYRRKGV